ncbi:CopA family copper-resistance protein [Dokdonella fugitiva]|uniref:CopA family copper-resistance protein n=1 Tax=Dokdonella fugitiva TaxID=328517 RepID=A0A839EWX8_9GAMM|nr:copper resistance system multicopper oxidase [Dokdonella fugitiva]MBA8886886.1 CopA family copper-resistance protein [Dokdonella fugitiva]
MRFLPAGTSRLPALPSRRRFVQGVAGGALLAACGFAPLRARSAQGVLSGTRFDLEIGATTVDFTGHARRAVVVNGSLPAPLLRWREGDTVTLRVRNALAERSSIHWHGIVLPADMDGVPGLSFMGIEAGGSYTYRFTVNQAGTYWYHSHSRFQEQLGLYGPIVVEPRGGERFPAEREHVVLLSDWTDTDPERIYATLKKHSDYYNFGKPTAGDFLRDASMQGVSAALAARRMWNEMRMNPSDLADVSGHAYTFLMNGAPPASNWTGLFERGERVRLRFINGASMTFFDVRIPGLKLRVVAHDGQDVEPVVVDEFRLAPAETCDVLVEPKDDAPYTIFAQAMDRSGYARGTLAPRAGMAAEVPALDARVLLTMGDMMGAMDHGMPGMKGMEGGCGASMAGMDHASMGHGAASASRHAPEESGAFVDMRVDTPRTNLDDPGVGLRDNGRRVLTYADLRSVTAPIAADVGREIELHLTGHMERYVWSFDGRKFSDAEPLRLRHGERVRIVLVNDTMMAHPIHLHGMWSELESPDGEFLARKHTLVVQPAQKIAYRVSADAIGRWAYHCHLLYHMEAGMFREVVVA